MEAVAGVVANNNGEEAIGKAMDRVVMVNLVMARQITAMEIGAVGITNSSITISSIGAKINRVDKRQQLVVKL